MNKDEMRELFENWIIDYTNGKADIHKDDNGDYVNSNTQIVWIAYVAGIGEMSRFMASHLTGLYNKVK